MSSSFPTRIERRKLRRGTTSCWECKRRKTRCHFEQSSPSICASCRRRGCKCVLQNVDEQLSSSQALVQPARSRGVGQQMERLEGLVDRLVRDSELITSQQNPTQEKQCDISVDEAAQPFQKLQPSFSSQRKLLPKLDKVPAKTSVSSLDSRSKSENPLIHQPHKEALPSLVSSDPTSGSIRYNSLSLLLQSILPTASIRTRIMHGSKVLMMSMYMFRGLSSDPFRLGPPGHVTLPTASNPNPQPIDLARSLFRLAICLQQSDRTIEIAKLCLDRSNSDVAGHYFEAASRYVTSQDSLVVSSEGIETLMLEGLYHVSTGKLQLAWLVFRRAVGIAHLMGLHIPQRRRQKPPPRTTNSEAPMCLATLWFRLVFLDRYLSLVLSLPITIRDDSFMDDLVVHEPQEKLERAQALLTSRIVSRNELMQQEQLAGELVYDYYDETKDIDYELKQAARCLPADWWTFPRLKGVNTKEELKDMAARIVLQLHHHNLVLLLHIPYVLPRFGGYATDAATPDYTNSKISAMFASRELLTRAIVPIGPNRVSTPSRGNFLKIILSALSLLLSHLDSHRLGRDNVFDHQRSGDLLLVERAINSLESLSHKYDDVLSHTAIRALLKLSAIEASAADGRVVYRAWSQPSEVIPMECIVREEGNEIEMLFPYVGTVYILRQDPQEVAPTNIIRSETVAANNVDGGILTPSWAWSDSSLSLLTDLASTATTVDDKHDASNNMLSFIQGVQDTWAHQGNDDCIEELPAPRRLLQDLDFPVGI